MTNNLLNYEKSSSVGFQPCNTNSKWVNKVEDNGHSKLWNAILNKAPFEEIKKMIENGADLNSVNDAGITALMSALLEGNNNIEMIKYLIENGIDVNAKNADNITAMMMASASIIDPEIIKLFITAGADVSEEDNNGYDAYKIAKEYNPNPAIAETIKKYSLMNNTKESILNIPTNIN